VKTDDLLKRYPDLAPWRPEIGLQPRLTDAELVTLAVMQALLGYASVSPAGCAMPVRTWGIFSVICPASPAITGACVPPPG
jgi:hypothetical protein